MTEWIETNPEVEVQTAEYQRLLGYPPGYVMEGRARELADWAREWYAVHGRPWIYAREAESVGTGGASVNIEGVRFHSGVLRRRFERAAADGAVLAAVSAGAEVEQEAQKLWQEEKPDEYYFLEVLGSAVVERLTKMTGNAFVRVGGGRYGGAAALQPGVSGVGYRGAIAAARACSRGREISPEIWRRWSPAPCVPRNRCWRYSG